MKSGDIIELSDIASLTKNKELNGTYTPLRLTVQRIGLIQNDLATIELAFTKEGKIISTLNVDGEKQFLILEQVDDFPIVNRKMAIDQEMYWLFAPPKDENNVVLNELEFTGDINDDNANIRYDKEFQLLGNYTESPVRSGMHNLFCGFVQYNHKVEKEDAKFLVLLEIGDIVSEDGGLITLNKGYQILAQDIKLI